MGGGNMATMGGMQGPTDAGGGGASYMPNVGAMHGMGGWNFLNGMNIMMQFLDGMNSMMHGIHASTPPPKFAQQTPCRCVLWHGKKSAPAERLGYLFPLLQ